MISGFLDRRVSVAPMMDWTDRHCRYFLRGFAPDLLLYTEMVTASAILRGDTEKLLEYSREEHPVALQLGGCEPDYLAAAARVGRGRGHRGEGEARRRLQLEQAHRPLGLGEGVAAALGR